MKNSQYSRRRIWSSFRLEEVINNLDVKKATGDDLVKVLLATFLTSVPPTYCWAHDSHLGTFEYKQDKESKERRLANVLIHPPYDYEKYESRIGLEFEKCPPGYSDCLIWCSKSNCETPNDFNDRIIFTGKDKYKLAEKCKRGFVKRGTLCYPKCELIGMVTCEEGICASSRNACKLKRPQFTYELIESYVNFLGHIYSLKSNTNFGWSDYNSFFKYKDLLIKKYSNKNEERLEEIAKIVSRSETNIRDSMYVRSLDFVENYKDSPVYRAFFSKIAYQFEYSLLKTKIEEISEYGFVVIPDLRTCVLENWTNDDGNALEWWEFHPIKNKKQSDCIEGISNLIKLLKPYFLMGFANGISKPLCPFLKSYNIRDH